jgi:hypothetical protein
MAFRCTPYYFSRDRHHLYRIENSEVEHLHTKSKGTQIGLTPILFLILLSSYSISSPSSNPTVNR